MQLPPDSGAGEGIGRQIAGLMVGCGAGSGLGGMIKCRNGVPASALPSPILRKLPECTMPPTERLPFVLTRLMHFASPRATAELNCFPYMEK